MNKLFHFFFFIVAQWSFGQDPLFPMIWKENGSEKWSQEFVHWKKVEINDANSVEVYNDLSQKELPNKIAGSYYQATYATAKIKGDTAHVLYLIPTEDNKNPQPIFLYKYFNSDKKKVAGTLDLKTEDFEPNIAKAAIALANKESRFIYHKKFGTRSYKKTSDSGINSTERAITFRSRGLFKDYYLHELIRTENGTMKLVEPYSEINWFRFSVAAFSFLAPAAFYYFKWRSKKI